MSTFKKDNQKSREQKTGPPRSSPWENFGTSLCEDLNDGWVGGSKGRSPGVDAGAGALQHLR